jgi:hypothetical protein
MEKANLENGIILRGSLTEEEIEFVETVNGSQTYVLSSLDDQLNSIEEK